LTKALITGGAGFVGHHLVEHLLRATDWEIEVIDKLSYASRGLDRLRDIKAFDAQRVRIHAASLESEIEHGVGKEIGQVDYILHLAAESHVDKSIANPFPFIGSNITGTAHILEFARRQHGLKQFVMFSTDEVYGPAPAGTAHKETDRHAPANPYAATKSAAEALCLAWANTYGIPVIITNTMNVYGERQHPEKFIPLVVRKVLAGERVLIHGTPDRKRAGSRFYIHARNVADAVLFLLQEQRPSRSAWNIVGEMEIDNLSLARYIAAHLDKDLDYEIVDFHSSRPGHDLRYALDGSRMQRDGWSPPEGFFASLRKTIDWIVDPANKRWLEP
jgi:dTDP-glucose 4,6-dehydratase